MPGCVKVPVGTFSGTGAFAAASGASCPRQAEIRGDGHVDIQRLELAAGEDSAAFGDGEVQELGVTFDGV